MANCKSDTHPTKAEYEAMDEEAKSKFDRMTIFMDGTRGLWVRHNTTEKTFELWHDGNFQAAWRDILDAPTLAAVMGREAIEIGQRKRAKAIKELLG